MTGIGTIFNVLVCYVCMCPASSSKRGQTARQAVTGLLDTWQPPESPPPDYPTPLDYCNIHKNIRGHEGTAFPGYTLRQLHIILSPGETSRPSLATGVVLEPHKCDIGESVLTNGKMHSFPEAAVLYRTVNGNKHAFKQFHPVIDTECRGETLTAEGFKQLIAVGQHLFSSYFGEPLKTKLQAVSTSIHAESIVQPPSYQSVIAFLHGLLPEKQFVSTHVAKTSDNLCSLSISAPVACRCPNTAPLLEAAKQALLRGRYMFKDAFPYVDDIKSLVGDVSATQLSSVELYEILAPSLCRGLPSACDTRGVCLNMSRATVAGLAGLASRFLQRLVPDPTFRRVADLYTYPLLERLLGDMAEVRQPQNIHVYSADRLYLPLLMTSLGLPSHTVLPLASRVVFELYQKNRSQLGAGVLYVRGLYNGEDVTGLLVPCVGRLENRLCRLDWLAGWVSARSNMYQAHCSD